MNSTNNTVPPTCSDGIRNGADMRGQTLEFHQQHFGKAGPYYFSLARGNDERLLDSSCTYAGARVAECHQLYQGRPITTQKVWRDPAGHIIGTSNGEPMVGYDPHYTWTNGRVVKLASSMQEATYTYAGDRLIAVDQEDMGDKQRITYRYDAEGDVIASSRDGAYVYDARKRLVSGGKLKLEWDDRDRLIRSTVGDMSYTYTYECR